MTRLVVFMKAPSPIDYVFNEQVVYEVPTLNTDQVILRRHATDGSFASQSWMSLGRFKEYLRSGTLVFVD